MYIGNEFNSNDFTHHEFAIKEVYQMHIRFSTFTPLYFIPTKNSLLYYIIELLFILPTTTSYNIPPNIVPGVRSHLKL